MMNVYGPASPFIFQGLAQDKICMPGHKGDVNNSFFDGEFCTFGKKSFAVYRVHDTQNVQLELTVSTYD